MKESNQHTEKRLGRGLSALLGESKAAKSESTADYRALESRDSMQLIAVNKIIAGIYQPRKKFDQKELQELSDSIKENGLIQPIILRQSDDLYEIIAGERRYRASKMAGFDKIPAIVKNINNHEALEMALVENIQRSDLSLIEEALGYRQLIDDFSYSQEQIAARVSKSRSHITNILRILTLPDSVKEMLDKKLISMGHARAIINSKNPQELAQKIIDLSLTVRDAEEMARIEKSREKSQENEVGKQSKNSINFGDNSKDKNQKLLDLKQQLEEILEIEIKLSYNQSRNKGKLVIEFEEIEEIKDLIEKLKQ
jgi:ParB family chromosome partitioning protein